MADRWIELFDVETDKAELLFVFDRFEPVDYGCGVFPLVEVVFFRDCAVDAVEDVFADFAYLGLRGVDESAGRFVCEVRLVILTVRRASPWPPNKLSHLTTTCKFVNSNNPFDGVQLTTVRTLQGWLTVNHIRSP